MALTAISVANKMMDLEAVGTTWHFPVGDIHRNMRPGKWYWESLAIYFNDDGARRAWRYARAWLYAAIAGDESPEKQFGSDVFSAPASHKGVAGTIRVCRDRAAGRAGSSTTVIVERRVPQSARRSPLALRGVGGDVPLSPVTFNQPLSVTRHGSN